MTETLDQRAPFIVKKVYTKPSPGFARKSAGMTLTNLKKQIKLDHFLRRVFREAGLIA